MKLGQTLERLWRRMRGQPQDEHEQRLMRLYWNRAELKKELAELQEHRQKLLGTLEAHQTAIRRAGEQIDELAAYLGRPEVGTQALLYFQLRNLWAAYAKKVATFVTELSKQQEERERRRHRQAVEAKRTADLRDVDERLLNAQSIADSLDARLMLLQKQLASLKWFWNYRRRREVAVEIAQVRAQWEVASTNVTDLSDERAALSVAPLPNFPGLSVDGKRMINTASIAYAEWLITRLPQRALAPMARHAISVQIFDASLGTPQQCDRYMAAMREALALAAAADGAMPGLKEITERLRARVSYRSSQDPIPLADSVGEVSLRTVATREANDDTEATKLNILADDYWSITQVMIH